MGYDLHAQMRHFRQGQATSILCTFTMNNNLYLPFLSACLSRSLPSVTDTIVLSAISINVKYVLLMFAIMNV